MCDFPELFPYGCYICDYAHATSFQWCFHLYFVIILLNVVCLCLSIFLCLPPIPVLLVKYIEITCFVHRLHCVKINAKIGRSAEIVHLK